MELKTELKTDLTYLFSPPWRTKQQKTVERFIKSPVPKPTQTYPLSAKAVDRFVQQAKTPDQKQEAIDFTRSIIHISFDEFLEGLCACTCALRESIHGDWVLNLVTMDEYVAEKSSEWVANLMVFECKMDYPIHVQTSFAASDIHQLYEISQAYYEQTANLLPFVIVDDISYSGVQLLETLKSLVFAIQTYASTHEIDEFPIHIHMLVPFIASTQKNKFGRLVSLRGKPFVESIQANQTNRANQTSGVCNQPVTVVHTVLDETNPHLKLFQNAFDYPFFDDFDLKLTLYTFQTFDDFFAHHPSVSRVFDYNVGPYSRVYSDHKLPDSFSVPTHLFAPLIEGCEPFYEQGNIDTDTPPCPPPPYKKHK